MYIRNKKLKNEFLKYFNNGDWQLQYAMLYRLNKVYKLKNEKE